MSKDYSHSMKNAIRLQNWQDAERLFDEVIGAAGLTSEADEKAQSEWGRKIAEAMNAKGKDGRKV